MIHFTSDLHFCHHNIIGMCGRPFVDLDEMHAALIKNWNSAVGKLDTVYILGDFAFRGKVESILEILAQQKVKKT